MERLSGKEVVMLRYIDFRAKQARIAHKLSLDLNMSMEERMKLMREYSLLFKKIILNKQR